MADRVKYAEAFADWLVDLGYTHCFFVAGGNIMHLLDGVRTRMRCVPTVHEVAAGIAAEYYNESGGSGRAFALVTAGPGLTNIVTAIGGAYLESRELLVVGGQAKTTDLAGPLLRQRGIQEIDGVSIVGEITKAAVRFDQPAERAEVERLVRLGQTGRPGPVFIEIPLDVQGAPVDASELAGSAPAPDDRGAGLADAVADATARLRTAERPVILVGGRVSRDAMPGLLPGLHALGVPLMTTWNGFDRIGDDDPLYFGRPNNWGQRSANAIIAQSDLILAVGCRLAYQQTGFNWEEFAPAAEIVQVFPDEDELRKGHPRTTAGFDVDADGFLEGLIGSGAWEDATDWVAFCRHVRTALPVIDSANTTAPGFVSPYGFCDALSDRMDAADVVIVASSGGANSVPMQALRGTPGQIVITDNGLASMGYALSGAIGAAFAQPDRRIVHIEGDGGFAQNLQELAIVDVNRLNVKMFIWANEGYGSIRQTQRNYFGGAYLGCDTQTGLGFPDWETLFRAYHIDSMVLGPGDMESEAFADGFEREGPFAFIVPVDTEQTYFPKITSRVTESGSMESNPLYRMTPDLPDDVERDVLRYLQR